MKKLTALLLAGLMLLATAACTPASDTPETEGDTTVEAPTGAPTEAPTEVPTEEPTEAPTEEETEAPKPERTVTDMYGDGYNVNMLVGFDEYGRSLTPVSSRKEDKEVGIFQHVHLNYSFPGTQGLLVYVVYRGIEGERECGLLVVRLLLSKGNEICDAGVLVLLEVKSEYLFDHVARAEFLRIYRENSRVCGAKL